MERTAAITAHALDPEAVLLSLGTDGAGGLSAEEAAARLARFGPNQLAARPRPAAWRRFLAQFGELVVGILLAASVIAALLGEWTDALAILAIVLLNAVIGFLQERKAERSLAALAKLSAPSARVVRAGVLRVVPARDLVPGDRIEIEAGDRVTADARLLQAFACRADEAALTGESTPVTKDPRGALPATTPLGDRRNMVYTGTVIVAGKASAVVTATGMESELGRIAGLLEETEPEPTPLQRRLAELGRVLIVICLVLVGIIFALVLWRGSPLFDAFLQAVSLAVAAVPEGLPAVVTIALALGLQRLVERKALIRRLPSVETLGSVTVICSDKTGTLTRNEMTVRVLHAGGAWYQVTGAGYAPRGEFHRTTGPPWDGAVPPAEGAIDPATERDLLRALEVGACANNASLEAPGEGGSWRVAGDPTEGALLVAALKARVERGPRRLLHEIPFDSERKAMSVVLDEGAGNRTLYTKGAPEVVLAKCTGELRGGRVEPLAEARRAEIAGAAAAMASSALRVLALAYRALEAADPGSAEQDLIFAGLAGMIDPPREEAREAVRVCRAAGIRPVMITGDHPSTALAIARELGIAGPGDFARSGSDLDETPDAGIAERVDRIAVYARVSAEHKLRVVRAWKARGEVVAMTGDGVNDAPAVKAADIGIAMGLGGTDVTREASAMVLLDDNFASIVSAVEEGRGIYDNIQKILQYLLSCNFGEILLMLGAALVGWPAPLIPVQILWVNLVTDGLPALALSMEKPEPGIMRGRPRVPGAAILSAGMAWQVVGQGILVGATALLAFGAVYTGEPESLARARTTAFCVLGCTQLLLAFAARSWQLVLWELGLFTNPYLFAAVAVSGLLQLSVVAMPFARPFFETATHLTWEWGLVAALTFLPVTLAEVLKLLRRLVSRRRAAGGEEIR